MQNTQNPQQPAPPVVQLIVNMAPDGGITVSGPIDQTILCYGLLEGAKDCLRNYAAIKAKEAQAPKLTIAPPGTRIPEPPFNGNGRRHN